MPPTGGGASTAEWDAALAAVTAREREMLSLIGAGKTNAEIAAALVVSEGTVKTTYSPSSDFATGYCGGLCLRPHLASW